MSFQRRLESSIYLIMNLTEEDNEIWELATKSVKRYRFSKISDSKPVSSLPIKKPKPTPHHFVPTRKVEHKKDIIAGERNYLDQNSFDRIRKGKFKIDAKIDLHGLKLDDARDALFNFLNLSAAAGKRNLLVVTGKGNLGQGKIKTSLENWLNFPEIKTLILTFSPAKIEHGGDGAFYIVLRKF